MLPMLAISAASTASQMLGSLLSSITGNSSPSTATSSNSVSIPTSSAPACSGTGMTGSTQGALSGNVLMTLMSMQQQSASSAASGSSTTSASTLSASDPLQQLFSAMDSNGDGSVSESEMESYVEGAGGTQANADSLYSALNQTASSGSTAGITENQMASAVSQAQTAQSGQGAHHHHHHMQGGGQNQAGGVANSLLQALDTNDDGSVSESELSNFVTANGGTSTDAASDFTSLNSSGSGSLTSADFAKAWSNLQAQQASQSSGSMVVSLLDAFAKAGGTGTTMPVSTTSVSA